MEETLFGSLSRYAGCACKLLFCALGKRSNDVQIDSSIVRTEHQRHCSRTKSQRAVYLDVQVALINFARDLLGLPDATSEEFDKEKQSGPHCWVCKGLIYECKHLGSGRSPSWVYTGLYRPTVEEYGLYHIGFCLLQVSMRRSKNHVIIFMPEISKDTALGGNMSCLMGSDVAGYNGCEHETWCSLGGIYKARTILGSITLWIPGSIKFVQLSRDQAQLHCIRGEG